jgi:DNA-binding transcriptional MerR regulator
LEKVIEHNLTAADMRNAGISRSRLRYWERKGLLRPARRPNSRDWRRYSHADVETARRMLRLLAMGLTLQGAAKNLPRLVEIDEKKETTGYDCGSNQ